MIIGVGTVILLLTCLIILGTILRLPISVLITILSVKTEELNNFCSNPCRQLIATLRRDYGSTPWQLAASIAGVILLILSIIQTVCSILQVL